MGSVELNGVKTYYFESKEGLIDFAFREKKSLIAINAEKILHATDRTRELFRKSICYSDGIGAVWALRKKGFRDAIKIPGCELWLEIVKHSYRNKSFYIVGATQKVVEQAVSKLQTEFQGIKILNYRNGYIKSEKEKEELILDVRNKKPDVVFVAMGSPKQELLIEEMLEAHPAVYQGLGGSLDVYVGTVQRAPEWWVRHNLEWAYRLFKQPSRIKRQVYLIKFAFLLLFNKI